MTVSFDPIGFKRTTRAQWEQAAEAWHRWGPAIEDWLGEATATMLRAADVGEGDRVLDVAAGAGGQTLAAARLVGPNGHVLATDISPALLAYAARVAAEAGVSTVETLEADGEDLSELAAGTFDAAISRVGLIYFPDQHAALRGIHRALRPGGRCSAVVYSTPDRNAFFSIPVGIIRRRADLPPPLPGQPGPFSLGGPGVAEQVFAEAGFYDITVTTVPSPVRMPTAAECVRFERESFGALHQMLSGLDEPGRAAAWQEITEELSRFEAPTGFTGPCEMLVVTGTR
ncbi:Methyltransferase type 11 [Kribbella flavida DSM 17836]|uniref:Methyltransferase type 11 n=1 Tax=Kribbella flavida (strain DSM 17836 / JCM 10339 / NBRC 14399) TaxID=479435 RepID=D2PSB2_KRIFD|nr:methyltransferase domain-containing protein [Kribbella flavida]ADB31236.1 Methyltransferase type 11 [Kribbella flavida DSM 17836]